ncbi:MAG TPA: hypothetical protein VGK73_03600 [Polyangiaceae bacterium]
MLSFAHHAGAPAVGPSDSHEDALVSERAEASPDTQALAVYDDNGVDRSLVRWMLSLTPAERPA